MIQIENVSFFYNDIDAVGKKVKYDGVFDINLQIKQGECVVLCGKSGCGKTTLLRMINGLIPHFYEGELQGKVFVAGCDIAKTSLPKLSECVGSVFQNPRSQFFHLDTTGELAFNIENQGLPVKEMKRRVASTIKELNLSHLMERNIFELSGGEKQRIACGTVYAAESEIIVFDEPSSNLDVESIFRLKSVIEALKRAGKTIVVSEHRLWYLWGVADRYVYMEKGMIKNIFTPQQIEDLPVTQRCKMGIRAIQEEELFQKISLQQMKENPDEETNNNGVKIVKLVCKRKGQQVIEIKDLNIPKHAVVAVIGANGVGKSTFCYALSGLLKAKGKVFISDKEYRHNQLKKISYLVMQEAGQQLFADTVQEELMLCDKTLTEEEIDSVLGKMNLSHAKTMHPGALSGGEKQRLALATALCTDRKIRFYDEPTSGQDMENLAKTVEIIRSLAERAEVSFVVTHDLECISQCATHILYLNNGRVEAFLEYKHAENTRIWKWLKERNKTMKKQNGIGRLLEFTGKYRGLLSFSQVLSAISAVFILMPFVCVYFAAKELVEKADRANVEAKRIAYDGVQEFLENIQEIKSNSREEEYLGKLNEKLESVVNYSFRNELAPGIAVSISQFVLRFGLVIVLLVGSILVTKGTLSIPMLLLFLLFAGRIYDPFSSCFMLLAEVFSALVSIKRMKEMEETKEQTGILECNPESYDIMFEDVRFSYNEEEVLKGISFTAKQGEVTALVGPSGSGKSTVSKLAARFWDATSGKVSIGDIDVASVEPEVLLEKFAIVFQDVILFDNTIMENIRLGRKDATDEEVIIAAKAAQCQEFIDRMPNGYQTNIGENGCNLSGGERQRISIARALLKNAPIVLLDEATASMDAESETLVQKALGKLLKNKTVLVIAHRMRTIAKANKVVVLEDGLVKEEGTPEELLDKQGLFYQLVNMQK